MVLTVEQKTFCATDVWFLCLIRRVSGYSQSQRQMCEPDNQVCNLFGLGWCLHQEARGSSGCFKAYSSANDGEWIWLKLSKKQEEEETDTQMEEEMWRQTWHLSIAIRLNHWNHHLKTEHTTAANGAAPLWEQIQGCERYGNGRGREGNVYERGTIESDCFMGLWWNRVDSGNFFQVVSIDDNYQALVWCHGYRNGGITATYFVILYKYASKKGLQ